jgi:hypothetical protein
MKEHKFMMNVEWLKNKFGFYLELYEQAFVELKIKYRKQIDQLQMSIADEESRIMNYQRDSSELSKQIYGDIPLFDTITQAISYIRDLKNTMNALYRENKNLHIIN